MENFMIRVGQGFDLHRLVPGRRLILGGITIPFDKGLLGHSDADVLYHAICDALLGAAGLGDIGQHFPDSDALYKDISSTILVENTYRMIVEKGFQVGNVDATVLAEAPKIAPYSTDMKKNLANLLGLNCNHVNVKAKTMERLGLIGRGEAIAAQCVVTIFYRH